MKMRAGINITLLLLIITFMHVSGEETEICGTIPGGEGNEIRLLAYADFVSYKMIALDRTTVSDSGSFCLSVNIREIREAYLDIDFYSAKIFLIPGKKYQLQCDTVHVADEYRPLYNKELLGLTFITEPEPTVNALIADFDKRYSDFVVANLNGRYNQRRFHIFQPFLIETDSLYSKVDFPFFKNYRRYKIASDQWAISPGKRPQIFREYLQDQPIRYRNPEFMNFFNSFFDHYPEPENKFVSMNDLYATVAVQKSLPALTDTLGKDTLLRNEKLRELVLLITMKDLYRDSRLPRPSIILILQQVKDKSKFEIHREIASNLITTLTALQEGTPAPDFRLPSLDGDSVSLSDLRGKPVYLSFMTTWSYACLAEFKLLNDLYKKWGDKIHFVTISLDKNPEIIKKFREEKGYHWLFLYNGMSWDLIHEYRIRTFPTFILIDASGEIVQYPAYKPSEVIEDSFTRLTDGL